MCKVLLISPFGQLNGGIAKWTDHIMSYYKQHGETVELSLLYNSESKAGFGTDSMLRRTYNGFQNYFPLYRSFKEMTKKEQFDVVHVCTSASISLVKDLAIVKLARKRKIKTIVHCHFGRVPKILKASDLEHKLFLKLIKLVDQLVVMDMQSYKALEDYGYNKVSYLPNPLAVSVQQMIEANQNIQRIPNKIVFAGHVVRAKGVFELVEACKQLDGIDLTIMGHIPDENDKSLLLKMAGDGSESWLHITGAMPFEQVIKEMLSCNVFVLPSYSEGFPNVIIESMACGCHIVATPVGAIPEMLNINSEEPCGICVPVKSVDELRDAIRLMIVDKEQATIYGNRGRNKVYSEYAMKRVWEQLIAIWKR